MRLIRASLIALVVLNVTLQATLQARADQEVALTIDNTYALHYGTVISADAFVASDSDWPSAETHPLTLPDNGYIYYVRAYCRVQPQ